MTTPITPSNNGVSATAAETEVIMDDMVHGPHGRWLADNIRDFDLGMHVLGAIDEAVVAAFDNIPRIEREVVHIHPTPVTVRCNHQVSSPVVTRVVDSTVSLWVLLIALVVFFIMLGGLEWGTALDHGKTLGFAGLIAIGTFVMGLFVNRRVNQ